MSEHTKRLCEGTLQDALSSSEIKILNEIMDVTRSVCENEIATSPAFLLIGMRALYFYFGRAAFSPALISVEIDLNFDILMEWAPYRHKIPNLIKNRLEPLGYQVKPGIGLLSILKNGLLIHLTVIFEHKEEFLGKLIPELQIHAGNKYFLIYSKLSRGDPVKDLSRLKFLFHNCRHKIDLEKIYSFAYEAELKIIEERVEQLLQESQ